MVPREASSLLSQKKSFEMAVTRFFISQKSMKNKITKCVVIKLGSSVTTTQRKKLDVFRIVQLVRQTSLLFEKGYFIVFVFSGAVATGKRILTIKENSEKSINQLSAGVGQAYLISQIYEIFKNHNLKIAQVLLTKKDLEDRHKKENLKKIIQLAISQKIVVIINENDVIDLNSFGGNDILANKIAQLLESDYLIFLTDVNGVYSNKMKIITELTTDNNLTKIAQLNNLENKNRIGGIESKILAAQKSAKSGIKTIITNGKLKNVLTRLILRKEQIGTKVISNKYL